jgi:hypothetical protein
MGWWIFYRTSSADRDLLYKAPISTPVEAGSWRLSNAYEILKKTLYAFYVLFWKAFLPLTQNPFVHVVPIKITSLLVLCSRNETKSLPLRQWRIEGGCFECSNVPPPPKNKTKKFQSFDKIELNYQFRGKYIRNNLIRIRVSLICKLRRTPD